jgi:hypothetical protein
MVEGYGSSVQRHEEIDMQQVLGIFHGTAARLTVLCM